MIDGTATTDRGWSTGRALRVVLEIAGNIAGLFILFQLYKVVRRTFIQRAESLGFGNARDIIALEQHLHLFVERDLQQWAMQSRWIIMPFNYFYAYFMWVFFASCAVAIIFAPERYRFWRRVFLFSMVLALPWYALYPLAPPRFMGAFGFVDTLELFGPQYFTQNGGFVQANQFAAMPSMHVGWTTIGACMIAASVRPKWLGYPIAALMAVGICFTVMVTGNHWLLDIVAGWLIVALALVLARRWPGWVSALRGASAPVEVTPPVAQEGRTRVS